MQSVSIEDVVQALERYLSLYPAAKDTLEGIHLWWIDWQGVPGAIAATQAALELLEARGRVVRTGLGRRELWAAASQDAAASPKALLHP
jgi:hypothetical protein